VGWVLVAWIIGGFLATAGALTYAELGTMYPQAGGNYVFLKEAYGSWMGFLYGWAYTLVTSPGTIALLAIGFGEYVGLPTGTGSSKIFSMSVVLVLTFLNWRDVKFGASVMDGLTLTKIVVMFTFVIVGFAFGKGNAQHFFPLFGGDAHSIFIAIGAALVPMAFTYSGWNSTVLVAEEVKNPDRLIPSSLILGTLATTAIYVLMNAGYFYGVPLQQLVGEVKIADLAAERLFSPWAKNLTKGLVALSVLGCLSASLLANPRIVFALGRDGLFFKFAGKIHPKYQTPSGAVMFQGLWACVLILWGNFSQILSLLSVPLVILSAFTVASVFVFRIKRPEVRRPYRCWGYPIIPALYVIISCLMIYSKWQAKGIQGLYGILIFILGVPVYYFWKTYVLPKNQNPV